MDFFYLKNMRKFYMIKQIDLNVNNLICKD